MCSKNQFHMTRMYIAKESVSLGCKKKGWESDYIKNKKREDLFVRGEKSIKNALVACVTASKILSSQPYFQENQNKSISKDGNVVEAVKIGNMKKDPFVTGLKYLVACIRPNPDITKLLVSDGHTKHLKNSTP